MEVFKFFFSGDTWIFKVYSFGPATNSVLVGIEKICCNEVNGAWLRTLAAKLQSTVYGSLFGKNSAGKKFTAIPVQRKHLWNVSANVRGR